MGTAIKHPVPDRVKPSFGHSDAHMATVGFKGLIVANIRLLFHIIFFYGCQNILTFCPTKSVSRVQQNLKFVLF